MSYWETAMENRMNTRDEVGRLETVLMGYLYRHNENAKAMKAEHDIMTPLEFWDTKRPYGNKNIEASIAFNLGWDNKRILLKEYVPEWIKEEAMKIHNLLKTQLEENSK